MTEIGPRNLLILLALVWCREGGEPPRPCDRRILSPKLGLLQQAARQRRNPHNLHRTKDLRAIYILQDVAVNGSNVRSVHAPKRALNLGLPDGI